MTYTVRHLPLLRASQGFLFSSNHMFIPSANPLISTFKICSGSKSSRCGVAETNWTRNHEVAGLIPGLTQWVKDPVLLWLWHRLQTWLRSVIAVAVAVAGGYSSNWTPRLGTSICHECSPKKKKFERERKKKEKKKN